MSEKVNFDELFDMEDEDYFGALDGTLAGGELSVKELQGSDFPTIVTIEEGTLELTMTEKEDEHDVECVFTLLNHSGKMIEATNALCVLRDDDGSIVASNTLGTTHVKFMHRQEFVGRLDLPKGALDHAAVVELQLEVEYKHQSLLATGGLQQLMLERGREYPYRSWGTSPESVERVEGGPDVQCNMRLWYHTHYGPTVVAKIELDGVSGFSFGACDLVLAFRNEKGQIVKKSSGYVHGRHGLPPVVSIDIGDITRRQLAAIRRYDLAVQGNIERSLTLGRYGLT